MLAALPHHGSFPFTTAASSPAHMLDLHLPRPMPHAVPRESSLTYPPPLAFPLSATPHNHHHHHNILINNNTHNNSNTQNNNSKLLAKIDMSALQLPAPHIANNTRRQAPMPVFHASRNDQNGVNTTNTAVAAAGAGNVNFAESSRRELSHALPAIGATGQVRKEQSPLHERYQPQQQQAQQDMTPRKKWAISPNLQIPDAIKTPQSGLPQLAAEITCLFWFESSSTLKQVSDSTSAYPTKSLVSDAIPTMGFRKWVTTILTTTQVAPNVIILALLFIYKLKLTNPSVKGKPGSEYRLLTVALMLGNKFLDDNTYTNKTWAEVSGISVQEVHIMEVEFLSNMRYSLFTSKSKWMEWEILLGQFGTFYSRAARLPSPNGSPTALLTPLHASANSFLSSPSGRKHPSPQNTLLYSPAHGQSMATPLFPPQAGSATHSPLAQLPELGPITQRKRSADHSVEPSPKRMAYGFTPGPYSNAPLVPSLQPPPQRTFDAPVSMHKLPSLPSLSIPAPQSNPPQQIKNWSDLSLPTPGTRAMASVFPSPAAWPSSNTPVSTVPPSYPVLTPTAGDASRQMSPYVTSANTSPHGVFGHSNQMSPSYFLNQRQSPYRPVRGVQTLLVPPPTTSMYDAARNVAHEHIQYQPLGRPTTERRVGTLPEYGPWTGTNPFYQQPIPQPPMFR